MERLEQMNAETGFEHKFRLDNVEYVVRQISDEMTWGEGSIVSPELSLEEREQAIIAATKSIVHVSEEDLKMSGCTDGRIRLEMLDGSEAPVLQKDVGCDSVIMFVVAETLGSRFYGDAINKSPIEVRQRHLLKYMVASGLIPSSHVGCGARGGLIPVVNNFIKYAQDPQVVGAFSRRLSAFSGQDVLPDELSQVATTLSQRIAKSDLEEYDPDRFLELIIEVSPRAAGSVKKLLDDGHGVHGHTEAAILRLKTPGLAYSARENRKILTRDYPDLALLENFTVNDDREIMIAKMMADDDVSRKISLIAIQGFGDAGHATLSKGLPTYMIHKV